MKQFRGIIMLTTILLVAVIVGLPKVQAADKTYTVTANLFVPGKLNTQLPGINAYLTNGNNPLGIEGYPAIAPTQPVSNNAKITIGADGKKTVVIDILNPVFTLQQIESGKNVNIINKVKDDKVYSVGSNSIKGRITQITVELLDDSGTYTFTNCREYPTLLGVYWEVPLTLQVDLASLPEDVGEVDKEESTEATTEEVVLSNGTVITTVRQPDGSKVVSMNTKLGSSSITSITAKGQTATTITLSQKEAIDTKVVATPIEAITASNQLQTAPTIKFTSIGDDSIERLNVSIPVTNATSSTVIVKVNENGTKIIGDTKFKDGNLEFVAEKNVTYKVFDNSKSFSDVKTSAWYWDLVQYTVAREWIEGTNNKFKPNEAITRAVVVSMLHKMAGQPSATKSVTFKDVAANASYKEAVAWANENSYVKGYNAESFGPNNAITREQYAVILWRYANSPKNNKKPTQFKDFNRVSTSAQEAMAWAVQHQILTGKANAMLDPKGKITRAQAAKMTVHFFENVQ